MILTAQDYRLLSPVQRAILAVLTFTLQRLAVDYLYGALLPAFPSLTLAEIKNACKGLDGAHLCAFKDNIRILRTCRFAADALLALRDEALHLNWLDESRLSQADFDLKYDQPPSSNAIAQGRKVFTIACAIASNHVSHLFETNTRHPRSAAYCEFLGVALAFLLEKWPLVTLPADSIFIPILPHFARIAFLFGAPIRELLACMRSFLDQYPIAIQHEYFALCVWSGQADLLPTKDYPSNKIAFLDACRALFIGDIKSATASLKYWEPSYSYDEGARAFSNSKNVAPRLLAATAFACEKPNKIAKTRPIRLVEGCAYVYAPYDTYSTRPLITDYNNLIREIGRSFKDNWGLVVDGNAYALSDFGNGVTPIVPSILLAAWDYHQSPKRREINKPQARLLWKLAHDFADNGWPTLARLLAALLSGAYDAQQEAPFLAALDAKGVNFLPREDPQPVWKLLLQDLDKITRSKSAREKNDEMVKQKLFWCVKIKTRQSGDADISDVYPLIQTTISNGQKKILYDFIELDTLVRGKTKRLLGDRDTLLAEVIYHQQDNYGYYSSHFHMSRKIAASLCEMDNLTTSDCDIVPIRFTREACKLTTTIADDGGLELSVPPWALSSDDWFIVKKSEDEYAFIEIDEAERRILALFSRYSADGKIAMPRAALNEASPILEKTNAILPLAEPSAGSDNNLRRVKADSSIRLRLDFTDGILKIRAVVLPIPENKNLVLDAGVGQAEKLVTAVAGSYVLVRDLAAEKANLAPVQTALADSENWFDGNNAWSFDDLAAGIAALTTVKSLGTVPLEWSNDRQLRVTNAPASGVRLASKRTADDWFRVEGDFHLDDGRVLTVVDILTAADSRVGNFVKLSDGDYVALTKEMVRELEALKAAGRRKGSAIELTKAAIPMLDTVFEKGDLELPDAMAVTAKEIRAAFARKPKTPATLTAELRDYQLDGYRWLSRLAACGFGSCLADDMGLGKTIQVICLLIERADNGPSLVIAPSSVCGNWRRELERFAPTLTPIMAMEGTTALSSARSGDVVIASYGYILFHKADFAAVTWNGLILDEAQAIKNDASKRAQAVKDFHAKFRVAATGTPVENRLSELWSLFDFLNPGLLGPAASFANRFTVDGKASPDLKRLVKPLILRRLKGDVLDDLPEKTEVTIPVELGSLERDAYEGCRQHALLQLQRQANSEKGPDRMSILAELTRLRRYCCHPSLVLPGERIPSAKMEALVDLLEGLHDGRHRALVFSQFTDYLAIVRKTLEAHGWSYLYLDGATPTLERERLVNDFQRGTGEFFLISLKAGGTGLNLTAANYVILLDPWWNPAVENQAADRAHRIGQKNPVTVYRLIASNTVEARVIELHREKQQIAEDVLDGTGSTSLSPAQLMQLFG